MDWDFLDMLDYGEESSHDEKTMTDLHLASALNLDHVEFLLKEEFNQYPIFIPDYQRNQWDRMMSLTTDTDYKEVGLLSPSQEIFETEAPKSKINQTVYKSLISIVGRSLKKRGIAIPLSTCWENLSNSTILVNSLYMEMFRFVLRLTCMISEASRGGEHSYYESMRIDNECAISQISYGKVKLRFIANNAFCVIEDISKKRSYFGSFDSMLLLMDTLGQRICLEIGCQVARIGNMNGVPSPIVLSNILGVGDAVLRKYKNDGYDFIALFESLVVSTILKRNPDKVTNSSEFFDNCRGELIEMVQEGTFPDTIVELFDAMSEFLKQLSDESLSNIFCIYRIWGHPRVDIKAGMQKVMDKGLLKKNSSSTMSMLVVCQFRKMFLTEFYSKFHNYPPCDISDESTYAAGCITSQLPINVDNERYSIYDFNDIDICKMWELPETYDVCHILNDKAVSPTRSEMYLSLKSGKGAVLGTQRRGIIRWLTSDSIRCKEFLAAIDENGIEEDSLIIGMYEKEREIKIKARMFSLMSEQMRMYFILTEEMIAEHLLKYFPQITMKDPLHIQIKKLWNVSGISNENCLDPVINIDFEKWNLNMREEFTSPLFKQMDKMFGYTNLISRTHEIFRNSYIYSSSGKYLPGITATGLSVSPPMSYIGHEGGFEGLRQKGWTVATVCLLCYIADHLRIKINLLGQGDNQVIRIYMPHSYWENLRMAENDKIDDAKRILKEFMVSMETYFGEAGLPIKIRETWTSTRLYMYGKSMYLDGNSLPQWTKKLLRSYALSNEGTLTISGVIGTIATNMCAAAHASEKPDIMYALYLILGEWSLEYLFSYHPFTRKSLSEGSEIQFRIPSRFGKRNNDSGRIVLRQLTATILMIPTSVGGSISIPLLGFIIRGFPDNASEGYTWLKLLCSVESEFKDMFKNWYSFLCNETREYDMLVQAPWSLNHMKPPTPGLQSRETVREWILSGEFQNNTFISNMSLALQGFDRKFVCGLLVGRKMNPLILHELFNSFPQVYLDQVLRRVENTRTIRKMALRMDLRDPIVSKLMEIEHEFLGYLYWRGFQEGFVFSECATEHCRKARNIGWGAEIKGLTTPHPVEFLFDQVCDNYSGICPSGDYIFVKFDEKGEFPPYLGSNVKTKVVSLQDISIRAEPLTAISSKLLRYASWLNLGENSLKLISENIKIVCDTSVFQNIDEKADSFYSGCVEHRFNPSCASEGCFINYAPQIGRKVFLSSDCMPRFGRGSTNYTLHFQAMFCFLQYVASNMSMGSFGHYHLNCENCIVPVDDEVDDISDVSEMLERLYTNERVNILRKTLGYLDVRVDSFEDRMEKAIRPILMVLPIEHNPFLIRSGIHSVLASMCASMIMYTPRGIPDMMGSDDLQAFPRIYSYKVSGPRILEETIDMLFIIKASRMDKELDDLRKFSIIKEKLSNHLLKITLDKFKGLGSLLVGRTWMNDEDNGPLQLNLGEFPETPITFLNAVRAEVVEAVSRRCKVRRDNRSCQIPILTANERTIKLCLISKLHSVYFCQTCGRNSLKWLKSDEDFIDCQAKHMEKIRTRIKGVTLPMDVAIKMISVLPQTEEPIETSVLNKEDIFLMKKLDTGTVPKLDGNNVFNVLTDIIKSSKIPMQIRLPTGAIYKWDHMLSFASSESFNSILVFGDGVGYTSLAAARRFTRSQIYPTALLEKRRLIPQDLMSLKPFASRRYKNVSGRLIQEVSDDILSKRWEEDFLSFLNTLKGNALIISDIEGDKGNKSLILLLFQMMKKIKTIEVSFLMKIYLQEWSSSELEGLEVYVSPFGNLHYGECFISDVFLGGIEEDFFEIFESDKVSSWVNTEGFLAASQQRNIEYFEAVESSLRIAKHVLNRNMIPLSNDDLELPACAMLYKVILYVSGNFKPPNLGRFRDDRRNMLDGTLIRIIKGIKMILIIAYGKEVSEKEYFKQLHLARSSSRTKLDGLRNLKLLIVEGMEEHSLSRKEEAAADVLRIEWLKKHKGTTLASVPETIRSLYIDEIMPGKRLFNVLRM